MYDSRSVAVSPRHQVRLAQEYVPLLERAPQSDFVVRTIETRAAAGLPLMAAEIVIAGRATRERHALARTYPLHFRKTHFPGSLHVDPKLELEHTERAAMHVPVPLPIGFEARVYRSCLVPGTPYRRLSPFQFEPEESNLPRAIELPLATAVGLWRLVEEAFARVRALHAAGLAHGDLALQNIVVCPAPLEVVLVDFEKVAERERLEPEAWQARCADDLAGLLREAVLLQIALGRQTGPLAELALGRVPELFGDAERFRRAIDERPRRA